MPSDTKNKARDIIVKRKHSLLHLESKKNKQFCHTQCVNESSLVNIKTKSVIRIHQSIQMIIIRTIYFCKRSKYHNTN